MPLPYKQKKQTRSLKKLTVDKTVIALARERVHHTYDLFDQVAVFFSGGKDSTAVVNIALDVARERGRLPLEVIFWDEECIAPETEAYVARMREREGVNLRWLCVPIQHRNGCSTDESEWYPWDVRCPEKWTRQPPPFAELELPGYDNAHPIPMANEGGGSDVYRYLFPKGVTVGVMLGIRADESLRRYRALTMRRSDNYIKTDACCPGSYVVKPIYDWRTVDVWRACRDLGWDYNRAYDHMELSGISPSNQRVAPPFGEQPMQNLWMWQVCWPEQRDKMVDRVPGAATAARYARTELYSFGMNLAPPKGMTRR